MDFITALQRVKEGAAIARELWDNVATFVVIHEGILCIRMKDEIFHPWTVTESDIYAHDWVELDT
jgi:hypothetical protein